MNHQKTSHTSPGVDPDRGPAGAHVPTPTREPWLVRPEEAARLLAVSRSTLYELLAQGTLPSVTINRCRRIPVEALRAWLAEQVG